ncbi:transposase [Streptomyces sudanensis]|uniref:transposase n=1 Tax=Streptomyces sudanensis TaxID=436397 RepID=UPI0020CDFE1B|nr:transposase [Streptomyces sudanensis]MCP9956150.1 transposase [Streptomyces sudanensis]MCQ0003213.1 transposase [Streptomyces sudanensis]
MASRKRIYDAEFREGAVRIVTETGKPIPEVAEDLGIHPGTLHSWVSRARRSRPPDGSATGRAVWWPAAGEWAGGAGAAAGRGQGEGQAHPRARDGA